MDDQLTQLLKSKRWQKQSHPMPVVAAIIPRQAAPDPAYLFIQRIKPPYAGQWALVGGKWDFGERLDEAITREVHEETGVQATFVAFRGFVNERLFPKTPHDFGAHFLIYVCEVQLFQAEPHEQAEGQVAWFTESQLEELHARQEVALTDYRIMKQYLSAPGMLSYVEAEIVNHSADMLGSSVRSFASGATRT